MRTIAHFTKFIFAMSFVILTLSAITQSSAQCTTPVVDPIANQTYNFGDPVPAIVFSSNVVGALFAWSRTSEPIGLALPGSSNSTGIPGFTAANFACTETVTSTFTVYGYTIDPNGGPSCFSDAVVFTITVIGGSVPHVDPIANQTYNYGDPVPAIVFSSDIPGTIFAWSRTSEPIGLALPGSSNATGIPGFTAANFACTETVTSTFTVNGYTVNPSTGSTCFGDPVVFTITVIGGSVPHVDPIANQTYSVGDPVPAIVFSSDIPGTIFSWSRTSEPIGLALPGSSNATGIPGFTAANFACIEPLTSTFTVYGRTTDPSTGNSCFSDPVVFTITIDNGVPHVGAIANLTYNVGDPVPAIVFSSEVPVTAFSWSRTSEPIGLALPGSSFATGIPGFTAANSTCLALTSTFTVYGYKVDPSTGSTCFSDPVVFTITVNPDVPLVDAGPNKVVYLGYPGLGCTKLQSTVSGGAAPLNLTWSNGSTNTSFINVCPPATTVYYLDVTDANNCTVRDSVKVCVVDVRCGNSLTNIIICHGTGSASNPYITLCTDLAGAKYHLKKHPGEKPGVCGTLSGGCDFDVPKRLALSDLIELSDEAVYLNAYPNPFSSSTTVNLMLPENDFVNLRIQDITGREIQKLYEGQTEGNEVYEFTFDGSSFAKGMYFLVMNSRGRLSQTKKLILDK